MPKQHALFLIQQQCPKEVTGSARIALLLYGHYFLHGNANCTEVSLGNVSRHQKYCLAFCGIAVVTFSETPHHLKRDVSRSCVPTESLDGHIKAT